MSAFALAEADLMRGCCCHVLLGLGPWARRARFERILVEDESDTIFASHPLGQNLAGSPLVLRSSLSSLTSPYDPHFALSIQSSSRLRH